MMKNHTETQENSISERLSAILDMLNHNQLRFVVAMMESTNKKEAAVAIGIQPDTVYRWPPEVDEAIELMRLNVVESAKEMLAKNVAKAALVKVAGLDDDDPRVRQAAATEVLDRVMGKPTQPQDITQTGEQTILVKYDRSQPVHAAPDTGDS